MTHGNKVRPFFPWKLYFADVFRNNGGFDVVIANPPYGNLIEEKLKNLLKKQYKFSSVSEISSPFVERGINLLKEQGTLTYIITYAITFSKDFSENRNQIRDNFKKAYIYTFDRDKCRIFESMTQTVSIIKCFNKKSLHKKGIFTSRMFRETPDIHNIQVSNVDNLLLPIGAKYSQKHRLPKIGEAINIDILNKLLSFKNKVKEVIQGKGDEKIWIRTSGNYWYNAWDKEPYKSSEIKPISIKKLYRNFVLLLMNSSLFYFWFRLYGDGRHMNFDILQEMPMPDEEFIRGQNKLLAKISKSLMNSLFSVFDKERSRFLTSNIKDQIDLIDLVLCKYFYGLNYEEILHIMNYDSEVRTGIKLQQPFITLVSQILSLKKSDPQADTSVLETEIDRLVYGLYGLTEEEIAIVEGKKL
jgi:predicted RNA methylase